MKDQKLKATIKLVKKDQPKTECKYVEDLLEQEELRAATHRHPIKHWLKKQQFLLSDLIETAIFKFRLWLAKF
jgi:hypothetical protein